MSMYGRIVMKAVNGGKSVYRKTPYDLELIEAAERSFKERKGKEKPVIYFDMDNTTFEFSRFGNDKAALEKCGNAGFYRNLRPYAGTREMIETLQSKGYTVRFVTACPTEASKIEKLESIRYNFPTIDVDKDIILVDNGSNKTDYIEDIKNAILVDDYYKNLNDWMQAGGFAIKKSFSGKKRPIRQVVTWDDLFDILDEIC